MRSKSARQHDSARQYLGLDVGTTALAETLALAAEAVGFPLGAVHVLDAETQHTLVAIGDDLLPDVRRVHSLCDQVLRASLPVVLADLTRLPWPGAVDVGRLRAFVGVPLLGREGLVVGTLCLFDVEPRGATPAQVRLLERFADVVSDQLELLRAGGAARRRGLDGITAGDVQSAVDSDAIVPWYQTVVDIPTGRVVGVEALARWDHPELGLLPPAAFLPFAERSDLIVDVDLAVMARALADLRTWREDGYDLRLNVNLSGRHFVHDDCVERLAAAAGGGHVPTSAVSLELTESSFIAADDHDVAFLETLREHGFQVWLDDFGTGWSSLRHLVRLPADGLKLDREMTAAIGTPKGGAVVRAVAALARETGLGLVVEGVESPHERDWALDLGCEVGQGWLWSKPAPADAVLL